MPQYSNPATLQGEVDWYAPSDNGTPPGGGEWILYDGNIKAGIEKAAWTHNNPGSVHYGPFAIRHGAYEMPGRGNLQLAIFPDPQTGWNAMDALARGSSYTGLTLQQFCDKWSFKGNVDKLKNMIAICNQLGFQVDEATIVDLNAWSQDDVQSFLTANSRSEGWENAGDTYFENDGNLPFWALDIFSRRWSNSFQLTLSPAMDSGAQVGCNDPRTPDQDPPNIVFTLTYVATWGTSSSPVDFPKASQLSLLVQDVGGVQIILQPRFRGVYEGQVYATITESGWYNVHADILLDDQTGSLGADKSQFQVQCD